MSGKKCGHVELNQQREAELRRQREAEARRRQAQAAHLHDEQRLKVVRQAEQHAQQQVRQAQSDVAHARSGVVAAYAATELRAWEQTLLGVQAGVEQTRTALQQAEQRFNAASTAWRRNPEVYQSDHFTHVNFAGAEQQLAALTREAQRLTSLAETRREEERLRRELEQQQAEAQAALLQAQAALKHVAALPHASLAPGALPRIEHLLGHAIQQRDRGELLAATATARQAHQQSERCAQEVQTALAAWQTRVDATRKSVAELHQTLEAQDQTFLQTWVPGQLAHLIAEAQVVAQTLERNATPTRDDAPYEQLQAQCLTLHAALEATQHSAAERHAQAIRRRTIRNEVVAVLENMGFSGIDARLADPNDLLSADLIAASRASGQALSLQVMTSGQIQLLMDDGVKGANCVADVEQMIEALAAAGVKLEMTDWGHADPDRVGRTGEGFRTGTPARSNTSSN